MARIVFYEKPGCINNTRQKQLLQTSGHEVVACNLLTEPWTSARLQSFFKDLPLEQWFNPAAPRIKQGKLVPASLTEEEALAQMLQDPLLIRRPLMISEGRHLVGFDLTEVKAWVGLDQQDTNIDVETCRKSHTTPS
ncbi:ArsC/Spx/MgsR family protein [Marinospirillum sp.]|uniref:ArsC/Spx/MgsR family protein n=1 Tax=Marinospirillum sp. TaxID=2183934 RepID=UPI00286FCF8A|nr:ArsC/Spx/MgsR family protein [Marinospirillum sp.]MDR9469043.1 ArsC/Spx/MgsR family protein [Marinospirillum sp.]